MKAIKIATYLSFPVCLVLVMAQQGCYYDNEAVLYPANFCDTTAVRFSTTIGPIIQTNCAIPGCHVPGVTDLSDLSTFDGVHAQVLNGNLLQSVQRTGPIAAMPPNGKLSDCDINLIRIWITAGAPQN